MARLSSTQKNAILAALSLEKNRNYSNLELYLKQLLSGREVTFQVGPDIVSVSPNEAWELISQWGASSEANLPLGDRGSMKIRAGRLLNYIQTNLLGKSTEAAASYRLILEQANQPIVKAGQATADPVGLVLQKAYDLRRAQISELQKGLIGKLSSNLEATKFMKNIPDAPSRALVLQMIAASNINFRSPSDFTPEKINQLLIHQPGYKQLNNAIHLAYSQATKEDFQELENTINETIRDEYGNDEGRYIADMAKLRGLSELSPSLSDVEWMVDHVAFAASPSEKKRLVAALRSTLAASSRQQHLDGKEILAAALTKAGLPNTALDSLQELGPYLEEIEVKQRHHLLGSELKDRDTQLLATSKLATQLGVDLTTPWLKGGDLERITRAVNTQHGTTTLEQAFAKVTNPTELAQIKDLISKRHDYRYYQTALGDSLYLRAQDRLAKFRARLSQATTPVERMVHKVWAGYEKIDNTIYAPIRGITNGWYSLQEKYPILDPAGFVITKWTKLQVSVATWINVRAAGLSGSGGLTGWFAGHIVDFTEGFIKTDASIAGATSFFFERKWGNILDWAAKKVGQESWSALKKTSAEAISKSVVSIGNKIAAGLGDKIVSGIGALTSESGLGLLILGGEVLLRTAISMGGQLRNFLSSIWNGNADNLYGVLPLLKGSIIAIFDFFTLGIPHTLYLAWEFLKALLKTIWDTLVALFVLAAGIVLATLAVLVLIFYTFTATTQLDANTGLSELVPGIVCEEGGGSGGSPAASQAVCIANFLAQCRLNPLTSSLLNGSAWQCLVTAIKSPAVTIALFASTLHNTYLQCVGFVEAVSQAAFGAGISPKNACSYVGSPPSGYRYVSGTGGMQPGDFFVIGSPNCSNSEPGHIGVVLSVNGAIVNVADANYGAGAGGSRTSGQFATSQIAGYLRKN